MNLSPRAYHVIVGAILLTTTIGATWKITSLKVSRADRIVLDEKVASLNADLAASRAKVPLTLSPDDFPNQVVTEAPKENWKTNTNFSFSFSYPPDLAIDPPSEAYNVAVLRGTLYLEQLGSGDCSDLSALPGRKDVNLTNMTLHYFDATSNYFGDGSTDYSSFRQGVICNYDGTSSMNFQYYAAKEPVALAIMNTLKRIVHPWSWGTEAKSFSR
jgi:hypothetical protein